MRIKGNQGTCDTFRRHPEDLPRSSGCDHTQPSQCDRYGLCKFSTELGLCLIHLFLPGLCPISFMDKVITGPVRTSNRVLGRFCFPEHRPLFSTGAIKNLKKVTPFSRLPLRCWPFLLTGTKSPLQENGAGRYPVYESCQPSLGVTRAPGVGLVYSLKTAGDRCAMRGVSSCPGHTWIGA